MSEKRQFWFKFHNKAQADCFEEWWNCEGCDMFVEWTDAVELPKVAAVKAEDKQWLQFVRSIGGVR